MTDKNVYPQTHWATGKVVFETNPWNRMSRQIRLATEYGGDFPGRPLLVAQLDRQRPEIRCYYTHPFEKWACQEPTFFHVYVITPGGELDDAEVVPCCPEHLALAMGLAVEMAEAPKPGTAEPEGGQ